MPGILIYECKGVYRFACLPDDLPYTEIVERLAKHGYGLVCARKGLSDFGDHERKLLTNISYELDKECERGAPVNPETLDARIAELFPATYLLTSAKTL